MPVVIIESTAFSKAVVELLDDDSYAEMQALLVANPGAGAVIQGTGGLRKLRWMMAGGGKRGGVRVIYFHVSADRQIRLLLIYRKGMKDDLTVAEKKVLRKLNEGW